MMTKNQALAYRRRAQDIARSIATNYYALGRILYELRTLTAMHNGQEVPIHNLWGFKTRFDWAETELGIHYTTARNTERIYEVFGVQLAGKWDPETQLVSRSKMLALTRILGDVTPKAEVQEWVSLAATVSCCDLDHKIEEKIYGGTRLKRNFAVVFTPKQRELAKKCMDKVFAESDVHTMGDALEVIFNDWLSHHRALNKLKKAS